MVSDRTQSHPCRPTKQNDARLYLSFLAED
jgi:hypothetical protein